MAKNIANPTPKKLCNMMAYKLKKIKLLIASLQSFVFNKMGVSNRLIVQAEYPEKTSATDNYKRS